MGEVGNPVPDLLVRPLTLRGRMETNRRPGSGSPSLLTGFDALLSGSGSLHAVLHTVVQLPTLQHQGESCPVIQAFQGPPARLSTRCQAPGPMPGHRTALCVPHNRRRPKWGSRHGLWNSNFLARNSTLCPQHPPSAWQSSWVPS